MLSAPALAAATVATCTHVLYAACAVCLSAAFTADRIAVLREIADLLRQNAAKLVRPNGLYADILHSQASALDDLARHLETG